MAAERAVVAHGGGSPGIRVLPSWRLSVRTPGANAHEPERLERTPIVQLRKGANAWSERPCARTPGANAPSLFTHSENEHEHNVAYLRELTMTFGTNLS